MSDPVMLSGERRWECPQCETTAVTRGTETNRFHNCRGMRGLSVPMVPAGTKARHVAIERADYIGREDVQLDGAGRPIMSVLTDRDDGQDCTVFASCVSIRPTSNR